LVVLLFTKTALSQEISHYAFQPGEVVHYKAYYNWNFVWLYAGNVSFEVNEKSFKGKETYQFEAKGQTLKSYEWLYKVDDYFQTFVDKDEFKPLYFERNTSEGRYKVHNQYNFNHDEDYIFSKTDNSKEPYQEDIVEFSDTIFDVLSAIYYSRNIDFDNLQKGEKIPLPMIIDNEVYDLYLRYQGRETIKVKDMGTHTCIKFSAMLVEGTIFNKGEHLTVWVTADKNRIPLMVEAKILVGSVKAIFNGAKNLKYPSSIS
jgi:hypothetical protein